MKKQIIDALLKPNSIAIIGASNKNNEIGYSVLEKLIVEEYQGKLYPINPDEKEIQGLKAYSKIQDINNPIDAAILCIPAQYIPQIVEECGKKGVKALSIITPDFADLDDLKTEKKIFELAEEYKMGIVGPNTIGVLSSFLNMNASFAPKLPLKGNASLVSQSSVLLFAIDMATYNKNLGFEKLISIGKQSDINFADLIEWLNQDKETSCISLYIEGLKNGREFIEKASNTKKPIIALKAGNSKHGAAAAASHTGSLAGGAKIYEAAFKQAGVIQASSVSNLFDLTQALSLQPSMDGENILIITNNGGFGVLATDSAEKYGIPLNFAPQDFQKEIKKHMLASGSTKNPINITGGAGLDLYYQSSKFAYSYEWVNALVILYCETAETNPLDIAEGIYKSIENSKSNKPVIVSFLGGQRCDDAMSWLVKKGIPAYDSPDKAMYALSALKKYAQFSKKTPINLQERNSVLKDKALKIINQAKKEGRTDALSEVESKDLFEIYGIKTARTRLAKSKEEAIQYANENGYPVVCKISSPEILHKSDAGGVEVNLKTPADVEAAWDEIMKNAKEYNPEAQILGMIVQDMAEWGTQVIVGSVNDPTFGPTVMFGLGGIFVEVLKDVTFRIAPFEYEEAFKMLDEIQSSAILDGARGEPRQDKEALADLVSKYSKMIIDLNEVVAETDANPVFVYDDGKGVCVVDARVILK